MTGYLLLPEWTKLNVWISIAVVIFVVLATASYSAFFPVLLTVGTDG